MANDQPRLEVEPVSLPLRVEQNGQLIRDQLSALAVTRVANFARKPELVRSETGADCRSAAFRERIAASPHKRQRSAALEVGSAGSEISDIANEVASRSENLREACQP